MGPPAWEPRHWQVHEDDSCACAYLYIPQTGFWFCGWGVLSKQTPAQLTGINETFYGIFAIPRKVPRYLLNFYPIAFLFVRYSYYLLL